MLKIIHEVSFGTFASPSPPLLPANPKNAEHKPPRITSCQCGGGDAKRYSLELINYRVAVNYCRNEPSSSASPPAHGLSPQTSPSPPPFCCRIIQFSARMDFPKNRSGFGKQMNYRARRVRGFKGGGGERGQLSRNLRR